MANLYDYNSSSARKLERPSADYNKNLHKELRTPNARTSKETKANTKKGFGSALYVVMAFVLAFTMVNGYVKINEANESVAKLKAEYNSIVASNQALQVKIDKTVDLNQLQTMAEEKFGMMRPERHQMVYVELPMEDLAENGEEIETAEKEKKMKIDGVTGMMTGTLNIFR